MAPAPVAIEASRYRQHPALLDACLQVLAAALPTGEADAAMLPVAIARLRSDRALPSEFWCHASAARSGDTVTGRVEVRDDNGAVLAQVEDITFRRVAAGPLTSRPSDDSLYNIAWRIRPLDHDLAVPDFLPEPDAVVAKLAPRAAALAQSL